MRDAAVEPDPVAITAELLRGWPLPEPGGSKHARGDVVIVGGSRKTPGAVLLAGLAALRVGAGRVTLAVGESVAPSLAVAFPESGVIALRENAAGSVDGRGLDVLAGELESADVLLVGPGLDDPRSTERILRRLVPLAASVPAIHLDAFPLGVLRGLRGVRRAFAGRLLITPNTEEAARLLGDEVNDPADAAVRLASRYDAVVSCHNRVATPDGLLYVDDAEHAGLATAGSGDVLAGATAGLRARGLDARAAACWGVHLHTGADTLLGGSGYLAREIPAEFRAVIAAVDGP